MKISLTTNFSKAQTKKGCARISEHATLTASDYDNPHSEATQLNIYTTTGPAMLQSHRQKKSRCNRVIGCLSTSAIWITCSYDNLACLVLLIALSFLYCATFLNLDSMIIFFTLYYAYMTQDQLCNYLTAMYEDLIFLVVTILLKSWVRYLAVQYVSASMLR